MTAPVVVPDDVADPDGFVLAVADLREKRLLPYLDQCWRSAGDWVVVETEGCSCGVSGEIAALYGHEPGCGLEPVFKANSPAEAEYVAAEADSAHALAEVALWRVVVANHQRRQGNAATALGEDIGTWRDVTPSFIAVVVAARAYLTGAQ